MKPIEELIEKIKECQLFAHEHGLSMFCTVGDTDNSSDDSTMKFAFVSTVMDEETASDATIALATLMNQVEDVMKIVMGAIMNQGQISDMFEQPEIEIFR